MRISELEYSNLNISNEDIIEAMKKIPGYLDITPGEFINVILQKNERRRTMPAGSRIIRNNLVLDRCFLRHPARGMAELQSV